MKLDAALQAVGESTTSSIATFITFIAFVTYKYEMMLFEMYSLTAFVASVSASLKG